MRKHPDIGWNMLRQIETLEGAAEIVRAHHEHYDGSGYPRGLRGEEIPRGARLFAVADAFDAITSDRPYRDARSHIVAVEEIMANSGSQFDPRGGEALPAGPNRDASSHIVAVEEIMTTCGSQFDPRVVDSLLRVLGYARSQEGAGVVAAVA